MHSEGYSSQSAALWSYVAKYFHLPFHIIIIIIIYIYIYTMCVYCMLLPYNSFAPLLLKYDSLYCQHSEGIHLHCTYLISNMALSIGTCMFHSLHGDIHVHVQTKPHLGVSH